jgi:hypothetical protein
MTKEAIDCVRDYIRSKSPELLSVFLTLLNFAAYQNARLCCIFPASTRKGIKNNKKIVLP